MKYKEFKTTERSEGDLKFGTSRYIDICINITRNIIIRLFRIFLIHMLVIGWRDPFKVLGCLFPFLH